MIGPPTPARPRCSTSLPGCSRPDQGTVIFKGADVSCSAAPALPIGNGTLVSAHQRLFAFDGAPESGRDHLHHGKAWELWRSSAKITPARPKTCCGRSASLTGPRAGALSFPWRPEATGARHCAHLSPNTFFCSTSQPPGCDRRNPEVDRLDRTARPRPQPDLSPNTTWMWCSRSLTASSCCTMDRCSPTASRRR